MEKYFVIVVYETSDTERLRRALDLYLNPEAGKRIGDVYIDRLSLESSPFLVDDILIEAMKLLVDRLKAWMGLQKNAETNPSDQDPQDLAGLS